MGALTSNRKREADYLTSNHKFQSFYPSGFDYNHVSKKPKVSPLISPTPNRPVHSKSSVSRISLYPQVITPIKREVHAPCPIIHGFPASSRRNTSVNRQRENFSAGEMGNALGLRYNSIKKSAIFSLRYYKGEKEVIDVDGDGHVNVLQETVNDENVVEDSTVVEEVVEEGHHGYGEETQMILAKFKELDEKAALSSENPSSSAVSDLTNGKILESLSLSPLPLHKKLLDSAKSKYDDKLRRLSFEIELSEKQRANQQLLRPAKKEKEVVKEPFLPLTKDDENLVASAFSNASRRRVVVTHENSNIEITGEVLQCLRPGAWLNDEVINVYLELLKEREKREPKKFLKCHFFNTFFYKKLISGRSGYDYKSVRRWTTQRKLGYSLSECDKIFVPVHKEIHWCLAVINKKDEKFQYLDSLGGVDNQVMRVLAKYFVDEVKDKSGKGIDVTSWKQEYVKDLPNQENGFDCGMFMIKYADFYSRDIGLCFQQEDMPYFRLRTAKEILRLKAD